MTRISRRDSLRLAGALGVGVFGAKFLTGIASAQSAADSIVEISSGRVRGVISGGVHAFKGIPYGAETSGPRRLRPPVRPEPWTGFRDATAYGPRATQAVRNMIPELGDALTGSGPTSEDCLRVNVWSAGLTAADRRPVMVFLHGGGYQTGSGNSILYDGTSLARRHGVVVVTLTHRLNAFGYVYLSEIGGAEFRDSANVGLLDLVAALEWVRDNISRFGGDPGRVTIFGESGGAAKVCMLMAMPAAKGLFHRAIVQSTLVDMAIRGQTPAQGTEQAEMLVARLGLTTAQLDRLRMMPAAQIVDALTSAPAGRRLPRDNGQYIATNYYPVIDGHTVPAHPFHPTAPLISADVPLLCGSTENEVTPYLDASQLAPLDDAALQARIMATLRVDDPTAARVVALYRSHRPELTNLGLATMIASDNSVMRGSEYLMAERKTALGRAPAFLYYFQWSSPVRGGALGAMHGVELPFVFHNTDKMPAMVGTGADLAPLADVVSSAWVAFAHTGNPSTPSHAWPAFNPSTRPTMVFDRMSHVVNDPYGEERRLLASIRESQAHLPQHAPPGCASVVCGAMNLEMIDRREFLGGSMAAMVAAWLARTASAQNSRRTITTATSAGRVQGLVVDGVQVFKGIPYGRPPIGPLRFMPPSPAPAWSGVRDAFAFGPRAPQPPRAMIPEVGDALVGSGPTGEDCLTLNVWTTGPQRGRLKPVVVWFHGGAYRSGSANSIFYDGSSLAARHDVVVVTVNHRLNVLGFLDLSAYGDERYAQSANVGLLDLVLALRWVRENAERFGGDPGNVTAWGQSGGGGKVSMLMGMPDARGLFHRAIIMSTLVESGARGLTPQQSRAATARLLERVRVVPGQIARLHDLPVGTLMAALPGSRGISTGTTPGSGDADDISTGFYPVVDGRVLPAHPFDPVAPQASAEIPVLTGSDETEGIPYGDPDDAYWKTEIADDLALRAHVRTVMRVDDADANSLITVYRRNHPRATPADIAAILVGDNSGSRLSSRLIAERKAAQGRAPAYLYYFKWRSPVRGGKLRTMHSMELPFVWDHVDQIAFMTGTGPERAALAKAISGAFMAFAHTGVPSAPGLPQWAPFDPARRQTMVFDTESRLVDDPYGEVRRALDAIRSRGNSSGASR